MKTCVKCGEIKPFTDFHRRADSKDGFHSYCKPCNKAHVAAWQLTPTGKAKHYAVATAWQADNKASHALTVNRYQNTTRGKVKLRAAWAKYHASKIQATPAWLTSSHLEEIESFYALAKELQWLTSDTLEVDHIVPLQGDNVCGLHVPWNLQVLAATLNRRKGNRFSQENTSQTR
jgi:5-methylcytosine-specific restriction endonuclease McrA